MSTHEQIVQKFPRCIATISAGFEKGDFLVREEKGQRVYFDFFEEAFNYIAAKGYSRMPKGEEGEWMDLMVSLSVPVGYFILLRDDGFGEMLLSVHDTVVYHVKILISPMV